MSLTPRQQPPFQSQRGPSPRSNTLPLSVAAAFRREGFGGAVFVEASDRLAHQFTTGSNVLSASAISGISVHTSASGAGSLTRSLTRFGGTLAIGTRNGRVSIGAAGYLGRFDANVSATVATTPKATCIPFRPGGPPAPGGVSIATGTPVERGASGVSLVLAGWRMIDRR